MTISLSENTPRISYSVNEGASQTAFTVPFEFYAEADLNFYVDGTKKTIATHYTVSGGDGTTGTINTTSGNTVTGISGGSTVVITRSIALARTTDFPASGPFAISTLNTELDKFIAIQADNDDTIDRALHLADDDTAVSMELPLVASRKGTVLGFNASTGAAEVGPTIANVNSLSAITANINTTAGIAANVTTVAGIASNVTTVAGVASNVTAVAGAISNVNALAASAVIADMALLATTDVIADMALLATSDVIADMNTLATSAIVADLNILATTDIVADMALLATSDIVSDLNTLATADIVSDLNVLATSDIVSDINTLATSDIVSDLNTLATSDIVTDLNLLATSAIVEDLSLLATSTVIADMATLAGSGANPNITTLTASGDITGSTFAATGDTAAGDNASIGYTAAEGLILTGQGSTNDVTIKNDADADVIEIPTGTTNVTVAGNLGVGGTVTGTGTSVFASLDISGDIDVDGTANLDAVDIDGAVDMAATLQVDGAITSSAGATITTANNTDTLSLISTDADASIGPNMRFYRNSSSPADDDLVGGIVFDSRNDNSQDIQPVRIRAYTPDVSDGTEDGAFDIATMTNGALSNRMDFLPTETIFNNSSIDLDFRVESNGNANMLFVDGGNNRVGIGTNSPAHALDVNGSLSSNGNENVMRIAAADATNAGGVTINSIYGASASARVTTIFSIDGQDQASPLAFGTGTTERMRIDSSGNVLVSTSSDFASGTIDGILAQGTNKPAAGFSNTEDGQIVKFYQTGSLVGNIGTVSSSLFISSPSGSGTGLRFSNAVIHPCDSDGAPRDNAIDLGYGSGRFDDIYATNATIQTSDQTEKQDIAALTSTEMLVGKRISALFKTFRWKDKVASKGDNARTHTGIIAQDVQAAFTAEGLDAGDYSLFISNTWLVDSEGNEVAEGTEGAVSKTRMGIRYPELLSFVAAYNEQRFANIETRLTALEG